MQELDGLMAKLEQDNRILAELDKKRACLGSSCAGFHTRMCSTTSLSTTLTGSQQHHGALAPVAASRSSLAASSAGGRGSIGGLTLPTLPSVSEPPNGSVEFLDLPGRGRCRVYVARYSYDPLKQSPNEHPEAELFLNAGDYILIFGD
ncbi:unnamed protein product, partial [Ixodes hexagonus]